jgi:hypothetical protein
VKCNVPVAEATHVEGVLPERVQEALGELVGAASEGLLALSVEVGLGVLHVLSRRSSCGGVNCQPHRQRAPRPGKRVRRGSPTLSTQFILPPQTRPQG